jgi:hypothetical protein
MVQKATLGDFLSDLREYDAAAQQFCSGYLGSDKGTDLAKYLSNQFPDITDLDLMKVKNSYVAESDPPSSSIPQTLTGKEWYNFNSDTDHNFRIYFRESLNLPDPDSEESIASNSGEIINRLPNPKSTDFTPVSGLVIGNVQSGKTANYTALIARAADSGYNLIIVLSGGNFNDLRVQTQKRLFKDLIEPVNNSPQSKKWHKSTGVSENNKGDIEDDIWNPNWDFKNENCLLVSKKNSATLPRISKWLNAVILPAAKAEGIDINLLLIDDEADHASLNLEITNKSSTGEASTINQEIRTLLYLVERKAYVGFTASPFANMFVAPEYDGTRFKPGGDMMPTLYPRDFIYLLPEPKGYFGLKKLCPGDEPKWTNHLAVVSEKEAKFYRKNTERRGTSEMFSGMKSSIFEYFISLGMRYIRKGSNNFHHSMLVHTKEKMITMHGLVDTITPFVHKVRQTIQSRGIGRESYRTIFKEFKEYYCNVRKSTLNNPPEFEELSEELWEYFSDFQCSSFPKVLEISSDDTKGDNLDYPEDEPLAVIAIGGNRLSRGFTLEGLHTSYFVREPKQLKSDTLLQQGRWFGFRGKNEDLVRIFTTESLRDEFWVLKKIENDLHDTIRHFETCKLDTKQYAVPILKANSQLPTSKDKLPKDLGRIVNSMFPGDYLPRLGSGFPIDNSGTLKQHEHYNKNQINLKLVGDFVDKLCSNQKTPIRRNEGHYQFDDVGLKQIIDLFEPSLHNFIEDPYNKKQLLEYLQVRSINGNECSKWTVAIMGNQPSRSDKVVKFGNSEQEFTLNLVQRTRKARGSNDFGVFLPQTPHFAIGMDYTEGETIKQILSRRDKKNPILLIYLIDKDSEPNKKNDTNRAKLGTKDHIAAFAIGLPLATLTSEERKNYNIEFWHNKKLNMEVKAE